MGADDLSFLLLARRSLSVQPLAFSGVGACQIAALELGVTTGTRAASTAASCFLDLFLAGSVGSGELAATAKKAPVSVSSEVFFFL